METTLSVTLLTHTPEPELAVASAARLCTSASGIADIRERMSPERARDLIRKLREMGHESPFEHAAFTFGIEGVSRTLSHQLVRHRIASFSQQSQRYVDATGFSYVVPPKVRENAAAYGLFCDAMATLNRAYVALAATHDREDARFVLPNAAATRLVATLNVRSLKNFFALRCCGRAQWEIRALAEAMLRLCRGAAPELFRGMGPRCHTDGACGEGALSCGDPTGQARHYETLGYAT